MPAVDLRALVSETNRAVHGVSATVVRPFPDDTPIATVGIWEDTQGADVGVSDLKVREQRRVMALSRIEVPTVPRRTRIEAPLPTGGEPRAWLVEGTDRISDDTTYVVVIPEPAI